MQKIISMTLFILVATGCASNAPQKSNLNGHEKLQNSNVVTTELKQQLKTWKGTPYKLGGNSLNGIDCSAFVQTTFTEKFEIALPRTTVAQRTLGFQVPKEELKPGDLIFFKTNRGTNGLHVGIYNGDDQFIHASSSKGVMVSSLNEKYWRKHYDQARRLKHSTLAAG